MTPKEMQQLARDAGFAPLEIGFKTARLIKLAIDLEQNRICAAINEEAGFMYDNADYMLDASECIKIARGDWVRPELVGHEAKKK